MSNLPEELNIAVCVPSMGTWDSKFGQSLSIMMAWTGFWRPEGVKSVRIQLVNIESSMLVASRHQLCIEALRQGATHLLFLDSDIKFPKTLPQLMLNANKDVLAADYVVRTFPMQGVARDQQGKPFNPMKGKGLREARFVGLGCVMIKAAVLKKLTPPLFMMEWIPEHNGYCGEDVYFSQLLQQAEVKCWVDLDLSRKIKHVGKFEYSWQMRELNPHYKRLMEKYPDVKRDAEAKIKRGLQLVGN